MRFRFPRIADAKDHILTAIFLVLSLALMVGRYQDGINNLRKFSITLFSYLEEPLSNIRIYREALRTNKYLRRQNVMLLDKLSRLRSAEEQNRRLKKLLGLKNELNWDLEPVAIVGKELNGIHNSLTINAGSRKGIKTNMPVINENGLIGKVILTSANYSQVMPFYNTSFRVSARIQDTRAYGIVTWNGESLNELTMNYVPQTIRVDSGQVVETSGYSNQFPQSIPIGRVIRTEPVRGKDTQKIFLEPYVSLYKIAEGFVVKFEPDTSIKRLDQKYQEQFQ